MHYDRWEPVLEKLGINSAILTSMTPKRTREHYVHNLKTGIYQLIIGTHAVLSDDIVFKELGLVIIDEQQRFGVRQRMKMLSKAPSAHFLMMSATPIPRSLALSEYGDLDLTIMKGFPKGRAGYSTYLRDKKAQDKVFEFLYNKAKTGEQGFIVCPVIEETQRINLETAKKVYEDFKKKYPDIKTDFLHGKLPDAEKNEAFKSFEKGETKVLVGTSIVEVGLDIKNATVMVIMDADMFGLSALHQLRGRIGRGEIKGTAVLMTSSEPGSDSYKRLESFVKTNDGFEIADLDRRIRGSGEFFGEDQSGYTKDEEKIKSEETLLELSKESVKIAFSDNDDDAKNRTILINYLKKKYSAPSGQWTAGDIAL
jgi:ATP-dependent DNA helicase RecG